MDFKRLKPLLRKFDDRGWKGSYTAGPWTIGNGGYDLWFELYYNGNAVAQCIAGKLSSNFGLEEPVKRKLLKAIGEVYGHLTIEGIDEGEQTRDVELGGFAKNTDTGEYDLLFRTIIGSPLLTRNRAVEKAHELNKAGMAYDPEDVVIRKRTVITTYLDWADVEEG